MTRIPNRILSLADQAVVSITNMLMTIVVGRACGRDDLGYYAAGFSIILLSFSVQKALILTPYTVFIPQQQSDSKAAYRGSSFVHCIGISSSLATLTLLAAAIVGFLGGDPTVSALLVVLAGVLPFVALREYARLTSFADLRFGEAFRLDLLSSLLQLSLVGALLAFDNLNARSAFISMGIAAASGASFWLTRNGRALQVRRDQVIDHMIKSFSIGRWLFAGGIIQVTSVNLFPWILITTHGASEAGIWGAAIGVVSLYNPVMMALYNETGPRIAHAFASRGIDGLQQSVLRSAMTCTVVALPFLSVLVIFGSDLVSLFFGQEFLNTSATVSMLAASSFVFAFGFPFPYGILALKQPKLDFLGSLASITIIATIGIWSVRILGAPGAAFGTLAATSAAVLVHILGFLAAEKRWNRIRHT